MKSKIHFRIFAMATVFVLTVTGCGLESKFAPAEPGTLKDKINSARAVKISTAEDLKKIDENPDGNYILTADIDLSAESWMPLCLYTEPFSGTLDGNGYCIRGMSVDMTSSPDDPNTHYGGLFIALKGATVKNLGLVDADVHLRSGEFGPSAGLLAGISTENTVIENCFTSGLVESYAINSTAATGTPAMSIGGFFGSGSGSFKNCYITVSFLAPDNQNIGGFVGSPSGAGVALTVDSCYWAGSVESASMCGGFAGQTADEVNISNSYYRSDVSSSVIIDDPVLKQSNASFVSVKNLPLEQLKVPENLTGFDFQKTWSISPDKNSGLPHLKSEK